jgi:anti-sigma B factor antagonist
MPLCAKCSTGGGGTGRVVRNGRSRNGDSEGVLVAEDAFDVTVTFVNGEYRVALVGELDLHSSRMVADSPGPLASQGANIVVDMGGVSFADSWGLQTILQAWVAAQRDGGTFHVVALSDRVERVLRLSGLYDVLAAE